VVHGEAAGLHRGDAKKNPFGAGNERKADMEALVAYVTSESRGVKMNVPQSHPKEREAYALGEKMFYFRGGTHDFACATCHGEDGKRIRPAGPCQLDEQGRRAKGLHDVAGLSRLAGRAALVPVAAQRLLPPAALSRARVRIGRVDRSHDVPGGKCQRRRVRCPGDQAMSSIMIKRCIAWSVVGAAAAWLIGCATAPSDAETSAKAAQVMKASFNARGQAGLDRLDQDETQKVCTEYKAKAPPKDVAEKIEKQNLALIKWPADGRYTGDWKNGERIAQEGRGMQYSDDPKGPCRRQLLRMPPAVAAGALVRHHRPAAVPVRQGSAATTTTRASTRTARSTTPRRTTRAPTCRASGT
jgi:hypothetical protein